MRKAVIYAVAGSLSFASGLIPQAATAQAELLMLGMCRKISDDPARLKCYDAIGTSRDAAATTPPPAARQEWTIRESKSPIDDSPQVSAGLMSEDGKSSLIVRCQERRTEAIIFPNGLFAYQKGTVLMRLNDLPPATATWHASTDNTALFAPNGVAFVKMLPDDGTLFIRATGHSRSADDATFKLGQVGAVKDKIKAACKWQDTPPASPKRT